MDKERRKALTRQYKETPPSAGIYKITNDKNGKIFIGASINAQARINRHQTMLKFGSDEIKALQADWREFGPAAFRFEIVDLLEPLDTLDYSPQEDLAALTEMWCEKLKPYGEAGYNKRPKTSD